jgi:hypothetical protein
MVSTMDFLGVKRKKSLDRTYLLLILNRQLVEVFGLLVCSLALSCFDLSSLFISKDVSSRHYLHSGEMHECDHYFQRVSMVTL